MVSLRKTTENFRTASGQSQIENGFLPNTSLKSYCLSTCSIKSPTVQYIELVG